MNINIAEERATIDRLQANIDRYQRIIDEHEEIEGRLLPTLHSVYEQNILLFAFHYKKSDLKRGIADHQRKIEFVQLRIDAARAIEKLTHHRDQHPDNEERVAHYQSLIDTVLALAKGCQIGAIE